MIKNIIKITVRNISRNWKRLKPLVIVIFSIFSVLIILNSISSSTSDSFYRMYNQSLTGDLSITADNESSFTLFGSDALLVGSIQKVPLIPEIDELRIALNSCDKIENWTGVLSLPVQLDTNLNRSRYIAFGVDFNSYLKMLTDIQILEGDLPSENDRLPSIMLQKHQYEAMGSPKLGSTIRLTTTDGISFTIREVILKAVYTYVASDSLMKKAFLADADVIRSLAGYVAASRSVHELPEEQAELSDTDIDDLFSTSFDVEDDVEDETSEIFLNLEELLAPTDDVVSARSVIDGAWHFILINLAEKESKNDITRYLMSKNINAGIKTISWRNTAGGDALIAYYLQIMINIGIGFILIGAVIITVNAVVLSLLERKKEIGSMRALGATKSRIVMFISLETCSILLFTAICGIVLGIILIDLINILPLEVKNRYLQILFGGKIIHGQVSLKLLLQHITLSVFISGISVLLPLYKVLKISPRQAMT